MGRRFIVYEVWTRSRVVEANTEEEAYTASEPEPIEGMSLCNWHIAGEANAPATGGLSYRQESITDSTGKPGTAGEFATSGGAVSGQLPAGLRLTGNALTVRCGLPVATSREYESEPCALAYGHKGDCKP